MKKPTVKKLSKEAVKKLREVVKYVMKHPEQYNQCTTLDVDLDSYDRGVTFDPKQAALVCPAQNCGTQMCLAGALTLLNAKNPLNIEDPIGYARKLLGITAAESYVLFPEVDDYYEVEEGSNCWPEQFRTRYIEAKNGKKRALVLRDRVEYFIKNRK